MLTTLKYVVCTVSIETVLGLGLALLVSREIQFAGLIRVGLILPMTIAPVVVGVMWRLLYDSGRRRSSTRSTSGSASAHPTCWPTTTAPYAAVVLVDIWEWTPLMFLIILAGLQSLPEEPLEAARVDGAGRLRLFFDHTLPQLRSVLLVAVVLRTIDAVGTFDQIYVLTKGGPGDATRVISNLRLQHRLPVHPVRPGRGDAGVPAGLMLMLLMIVAVRLLRRERGMTRRLGPHRPLPGARA